MTDSDPTGAARGLLPVPGEPPSVRPVARTALALALLVLAGLALAAAWWRAPLDPVPATAPAAEFSAERAKAAAAPVLGEPRVTGTLQAVAARDQLVAAFEEQGWQVDVEPGVGVFRPRMTWPDLPSQGGYVENVVATRPGTDPTGTLVLAAHYDSVPGSPGGGDDGVGIATLLEAGRILGEDGPARNDVVLLLTDAEEPGMLGASAFTAARPGLRQPVTVVNLEARGNSGAPVVIRSHGDMRALLDAMPLRQAESYLGTLFETVPNDTDFSRWQEAGWLGVDLALVGDSSVYHSPLDTLDALDDGSLQTMGAATLGAARQLAAVDLRQVGAEPAGVMTTTPWGVRTLPDALVLGLGVVAVAVTLVSVVVARRRGRLRVRAVLGAGVLTLLATASGIVVGGALWPVAQSLDPGAGSLVLGAPAVDQPYLWGEVAAAGAAVLTLVLLTRRRPGWDALAHAAVLLVSAGLVLLAWFEPSLAVPVTVVAPGAACALAAGLLIGHPVLRPTVQVVLLAPVGFMLGVQLAGAMELGVAGTSGFTALITVLGLLLVLPLVAAGPGQRRPGRRWRAVVAGGCWVVPVVLVVVGLQTNRTSAQPRQEQVHLVVDADTGAARWQTSGRSGWGTDLAAAAAPTVQDPGPELQIVADTTAEDRRTLALRLSSPRSAPMITLDTGPGSEVEQVRLEGRELPVDGGPARIFVNGVPGEGANVEVVLAGTGAVQMVLADHSPDLTGLPQAAPPDGWVVTDPRVTLTRTVTV